MRLGRSADGPCRKCAERPVAVQFTDAGLCDACFWEFADTQQAIVDWHRAVSYSRRQIVAPMLDYATAPASRIIDGWDDAYRWEGFGVRILASDAPIFLAEGGGVMLYADTLDALVLWEQRVSHPDAAPACLQRLWRSERETMVTSYRRVGLDTQAGVIEVLRPAILLLDRKKPPRTAPGRAAGYSWYLPTVRAATVACWRDCQAEGLTDTQFRQRLADLAERGELPDGYSPSTKTIKRWAGVLPGQQRRRKN